MKEQKRFRELREGLRYIQGLSGVIHVNLVTIVIFFQNLHQNLKVYSPHYLTKIHLAKSIQ